MKLRLLCCTFLLLLRAASPPLLAADAPSRWRTAMTSYPPEALAKKVEGKGTVRVSTDGNGWVRTAQMLQSTGSKVLDQATIKAAQTYWQGPPNTTATLPIEYQLPKGPALTRSAHPGWKLPEPGYPTDASERSEQGSGVIKVTTNAHGKVVQAGMTQSTGYERLDSNAVYNARTNWSGPASSSIEVPVVYRLKLNSYAARGRPNALYHLPMPPYPDNVRKFDKSGSGVVKFSTDDRGRVARAAMSHSTGNEDLDENTVNFVLAHWSGPPDVTREVAIRYRMVLRGIR